MVSLVRSSTMATNLLFAVSKIATYSPFTSRWGKYQYMIHRLHVISGHIIRHSIYLNPNMKGIINLQPQHCMWSEEDFCVFHSRWKKMMDPYICLPTNMGDPHDSYAVVPAVMHCLYLFNIAILLQTLQHTHSHSHGPEMSKKSIYTKKLFGPS